MPLTADDIVTDIRDGIQAFSTDAPFVDGFPDDEHTASGTSILRRLNRVYRKAVHLGFLQCYKDVTLTIDEKERRLPSTFGLVYEVQLIDENQRVWVLERTDKNRLNEQRPFHNNNASSRPLQWYTVGSILGFDFAPRYAYNVKILADVLPDPLVNRADVPYQLDDILHDYLVDMAVADLALIALRLHAPDGTNDSGMVRFRALMEIGKNAEDYIREVANTRSVNASFAPLVHDNYRGR